MMENRQSIPSNENSSSSSNSHVSLQDEPSQWKAYIGFGSDLNYLFWTNSWICLIYFINGFVTFVLHVYTYRALEGTLKIECFGERCWTATREIYPTGFRYNLMKHHKIFYEERHTGIWFGLFLMAYGLLAGFRFTRCVVNLGYLLNVLLILFCVLITPVCALEFLAWIPGLRPLHEQVPDCHPVRIRVLSDVVLVALTLTVAIYQLIINTPYIQHRSVRLIEPLITAIKNHERVANFWLSRQSPYHNIRL
ncbi:unnamed protein product [Echinostoma caproni]|uniref:Transmembrane protein n=1 Tax=Echinostoma caproni TaxID=27848 RepID=A0A183AK65_9TREM|nr:unnamed protein product [Echinostoma caproni]